MPSAALASICPYGSTAAIRDRVCRLRTTTKRHGYLAAAEGAAIAATAAGRTAAAAGVDRRDRPGHDPVGQRQATRRRGHILLPGDRTDVRGGDGPQAAPDQRVDMDLAARRRAGVGSDIATGREPEPTTS